MDDPKGNGAKPNVPTCADRDHRIFVAIPAAVWVDLIREFSMCAVCGSRCAFITTKLGGDHVILPGPRGEQ